MKKVERAGTDQQAGPPAGHQAHQRPHRPPATPGHPLRTCCDHRYADTPAPLIRLGPAVVQCPPGHTVDTGTPPMGGTDRCRAKRKPLRFSGQNLVDQGLAPVEERLDIGATLVSPGCPGTGVNRGEQRGGKAVGCLAVGFAVSGRKAWSMVNQGYVVDRVRATGSA